ncbi:uncharacterized protein B0H18DRAFT_235501 [Fomitopsis serialis]|uniref:uncharacterized protein n=1 Tax=Fomitopsis serialis TaxID=139415 RepID=UPI0020078800|nr:uncharacterized protein B0H18DRAFT_235501 [Neoantrodia serialis]KAH9928948.1 hypothetical protein B0H18DRAFT_235501 [Neoantrodia serialis]
MNRMPCKLISSCMGLHVTEQKPKVNKLSGSAAPRVAVARPHTHIRGGKFTGCMPCYFACTVPSAPDLNDVNKSCRLCRSFFTQSSSSDDGAGYMRLLECFDFQRVIVTCSPFGRGGTGTRMSNDNRTKASTGSTLTSASSIV